MLIVFRSLLIFAVVALAVSVPGREAHSQAQTQQLPAPAPSQMRVVSVMAAQQYTDLTMVLQQLNGLQQDYMAASTPEQKSAIQTAIAALLERVFKLAKDLQTTLSDNRYVDIPSFSMQVGLPTANVTFEFVFKK